MDDIPGSGRYSTPPEDGFAHAVNSSAGRLKRVLVIEDQVAICDMIAEMVQAHPRCELAGKCTDGSVAIELSLKLQPDILVLDVVMPGIGGIEVLRRLRGKTPESKVLVFSGRQDPQVIRALAQAGIHGFVNKNAPLSELRKALDAVALGNNWFSDDFSMSVREALTSAESLDQKLVKQLTGRELEIAVLISRSQSSKEIAIKLNISRKTVENHRANMMRKLGVHDVAGLVRMVIVQGLS